MRAPALWAARRLSRHQRRTYFLCTDATGQNTVSTVLIIERAGTDSSSSPFPTKAQPGSSKALRQEPRRLRDAAMLAFGQRDRCALGSGFMPDYGRLRLESRK